MMYTEGMGGRPASAEANGSDLRRKRPRYVGQHNLYSITKEVSTPLQPGFHQRDSATMSGALSPPFKSHGCADEPLVWPQHQQQPTNNFGSLEGHISTERGPRGNTLTPSPGITSDQNAIDGATILAGLNTVQRSLVTSSPTQQIATAQCTVPPSTPIPTALVSFPPSYGAGMNSLPKLPRVSDKPMIDVYLSPSILEGIDLSSCPTPSPPKVQCPPPRPFLVTTYRTRPRQETKARKREADEAGRRDIPPEREAAQTFHGPTTAPSSPIDAEDADVFPIVRIGDTIKLKFTPETSFDLLCKGKELVPSGQVALGFDCATADGGSVVLEFEVLHHAGDEGLACLRCQHSPVECDCKYANDLLQINSDWKGKKDPTQRLGLRKFEDGQVELALRIPRTRRKLSKHELMSNANPRPNTWNSRLKQKSQKDAKVVVIRMTERLKRLSGETSVLSVHQTYARLIAKNGGCTTKK